MAKEQLQARQDPGSSVPSSPTPDPSTSSSVPSSPSSSSSPPPSSSAPPPSSSAPSNPSSPSPSPSSPAPPPASSTPNPDTSSSGAPPTPVPSDSGVSSGSLTASSSSALPSPSTSTSQSILVTTNAAGQTVTNTLAVTVIVTPSALPGNASVSSGSSSHTGAIVGGVVGGVGGLIVLLLLGWFCLRRRNRNKDDFDGDFDPDRVVGGRHNGAGLDLAAADAAQVTPYSYSPGAPEMAQHNSSSGLLGAGAAGIGTAGIAGVASTRAPTSAPSAYSQPGSQSQYGGSSSSEAGGAARTHQSYQPPSVGHDYPGAYAAYAEGGDGTSDSGISSPRGYVPPPGDWRGPSPGPSLPTSSTIPSQKEREAALRIRNRHSSPHLDDDDDGAVVQHTDGGRLPGVGSEHVTPPTEVPPSYDSIRD